jgi:hypothetical protein
LVLLALASCSPRHGFAERGSHVASAHVSEQSSEKKDVTDVKERVRIVIKNDTIRIDSIRTELRYISKKDTIFLKDSIMIADTIRIVEYVDPRSFFQKKADKVGNVCTLLVALFIIFQLLKTKRNGNI